VRIARPLLLVTTPAGVAWGLAEAWRLHWWLALLMGAMLGVVGGFFALTVRRIRRERDARPP
jgi:nitrate/nitrite transporter NarK